MLAFRPRKDLATTTPMRALRPVVAIAMVVLAACHADQPPRDNAVSRQGADLRPDQSSAVEGSNDVGATTASDMSCAPAGGIARLTIQSATVGRSIRVSIVAAANTTPDAGVLYLLHGAGTDETQWEAIGVRAALDDLVSTGRVHPLVVVLPDLPSDGDRALDSEALLNDIVPVVERCSGGARPRTRRAVGGISLGGALALEVVADHADRFAAVGGHSPAVATNEVVSLAQRLASGHVRVWLDVGRDDALRSATSQLADALTNQGAAPDFEVAPGGHNRAYWGSRLSDYLQWYASAIAA